MHTAAASEATRIPSRVRTLDLKEKPEATLNKDRLKNLLEQVTSRSTSMCSVPLETQLDF